MLNRLRRLIPAACLVCGGNTDGSGLCPNCLQELPWAQHCCEVCAQEYIPTSTAANHCGRCLLNPPPFDYCSTVLRYESPVDKLIAGFKFNARFEAGHVFANLLADKFAATYAAQPTPSLLIPVPLHLKRLRQRGFNQALELSKVISRRYLIPHSSDEIVRARDTKAQTELHTARARQANLRQAFRAIKPQLFANLRHVAIIDDVVTTTATVSALSIELRLLGVSRIDVWCIARASR